MRWIIFAQVKARTRRGGEYPPCLHVKVFIPRRFAVNLRNALFAASLAAALLPLAARADDDDWGEHRHCHHSGYGVVGVVPPGQPSNPGHYETRYVQRWVPGYYES